MNSFQTIILGIFGFFIIAGLLAIALVKQKGGESAVALAAWGAAPRRAVEEIIRESFNPDKLRVSYREVSEERFDRELIEALAAGRGPDLIIMPAELMTRFKDKLQLIPYATLSERDYKDTYIQVGDLFLDSGGIVALPFSVDPLVMYYNRDALDEAGLSQAPRFWDEFLSLGSEFTEENDSGRISESAVALGEYRNVNHAKEILQALFLQGGNPIVTKDEAGKRVTLAESGSSAVLNFFTEFSNPQKPVYSWNRSLPSSKSYFLASKLAIYFGLGSEYAELRKGNPNLNFDIALFPRPRSASVGITYGKLQGVAILKTSPKRSAALQVALTLALPKLARAYEAKTGLPPVHRSLLSERPTDAVSIVLYDAAARSRAFPDPNPAVTAQAFQEMVESVTSGKARSADALQRAARELQSALR